MKNYKVSIVNVETGETIYEEESKAAKDLKFYVEQALENGYYVEIKKPEEKNKKTINFTELLKSKTK